MKKIVIGLLGFIILISCVQKRDNEKKPTLISNFVSISDNEDKGIKEVLGYYGGECEYSIGTSVSTKAGKKKYFELEVRKSDIIDNFTNIAELPASNIAYSFYQNLEDEKTKYDEIHTVLVFRNGDKNTFKYSTIQLELVVQQMKLVDKIIDILRSKDYESLMLYINNTDVYEFDKNKLIAGLEKYDSKFGDIKEFKPFGFKITNLNNDKNLLHITGVLIRGIQNTEFSIDLDLNSDNEEIYNIQYKY